MTQSPCDPFSRTFLVVSLSQLGAVVTVTVKYPAAPHEPCIGSRGMSVISPSCRNSPSSSPPSQNGSWLRDEKRGSTTSDRHRTSAVVVFSIVPTLVHSARSPLAARCHSLLEAVQQQARVSPCSSGTRVGPHVVGMASLGLGARVHRRCGQGSPQPRRLCHLVPVRQSAGVSTEPRGAGRGEAESSVGSVRTQVQRSR